MVLRHYLLHVIRFLNTGSSSTAAATALDTGLLLLIAGRSRLHLRFLFLASGLGLHSDIPEGFCLCCFLDTDVIVTLEIVADTVRVYEAIFAMRYFTPADICASKIKTRGTLAFTILANHGFTIIAEETVNILIARLVEIC